MGEQRHQTRRKIATSNGKAGSSEARQQMGTVDQHRAPKVNPNESVEGKSGLWVTPARS
jgi:hypothetical protein